MSSGLGRLVREAARRAPGSVAVVAPDAELTYAQLDARADRFAAVLAARGVRRGDRVILWLPKCADAVVAMQAVLRLGAAYVPVDPESPSVRARKIVLDCAARVLVLEPGRATPLEPHDPPVAVVSPAETEPSANYGPALDAHVGDEDLAYVLYTSGSTGTPKGVCISHRAALAFVRWAHQTLDATPDDRFSSHAPFHFDLSVLDLYAAFMAGARVCLIPEGLAYAPTRLVELVARYGITIWYSVPSVLMLMMDHGGLLEIEAPPRAVLFAGEPFPIKHLRRLRERFAGSRFLNLYGPTETNVCTFHEVFSLDPKRSQPVPIGRACCGDEVWAIAPDGRAAQPGETGELFVRGPTLMSGYWGQPSLGDRPYGTGDVVRALGDGVFEYVGRRDNLVEVRGVWVDLGEIEHRGVHQVAVVVEGEGLGARLVAFVRPEQPHAPASLLELKRHCAQRLPKAMVIDEVRNIDELPRNRNGKIDRRTLAERLAGRCQ
jgi:L-proline---[L-prolyl-carrier protein] ligase